MWTPGPAKGATYPGDDDLANELLDQRPAGVVPFRGPLVPALGIVWSAATSIFPDSGLMHFASASPGGVLGLFGDPPDFIERWHPLGNRSHWLGAPEIADIADEDVLRAVEARLRSSLYCARPTEMAS
jgi:ADP-heptose:LPS heptosyltransferase